MKPKNSVDILFGNRTAAVILLFLQRHGTVWAGELSRELKIPVNMIQKQLWRLEYGGIIESDTKDKKRLYCWNRSCAFLPALKRLLKMGNAVYAADPADGSYLSVAERLALAASLTDEAQKIVPKTLNKTFVQTFKSYRDYAKWKRRQKSPWLV